MVMLEGRIFKIFCKIYTKKYLNFILLFILMCLNSLFIYISAKILAEIYDNSKNGNLNELLLSCGILFSIWIIIKIIGTVSDFYIKITSEKLCLNLIYQVTEKIIYSDYSWISKREKGEILQVLTDDINQFKALNINIIPQFLYSIILAFTSGIFLYQLNPLLLFISVIIYPLCTLPVILLAKLQQQKKLEIRNINENLKRYILQAFDNIKDIKIFNKENKFIKKYYKKQKEWSNKLFQIYFINSVTKNIPRIISALVPTIVYIIGGYFYFKNEVSIGKLLVSVTMATNLYVPI
ncbi:MAG: ABC transporter ATP-binding protein, partial [Leptotrichiaceae bacterium]|nr:ABC transporter ATP-binding protein [Leptotrichiaceae bacterium]